jgi:hypothetical protein
MEGATEQKQPLNHDDVAKVARELWQKEGCQNGRDLEYWLKAEQALLAASGNGRPGARARNARAKLNSSPKKA